METIGHMLCVLVCLGLLSGCQPQASHRNAIPFEEGQSYAVAYLGYQQTTELDYYAARYLDGEPLPIHYLSDGDYYLVIPRYDGMEVALYRNDIEGGPPVLLYEAPDCQPFVLQCNASDIFPDATIRLTYREEQVEFSPFISLKDGALSVGSQGLALTKDMEG